MAVDVFCRFLPDILLLTKAPVFVWFDGTVIVYYYYPFNFVLQCRLFLKKIRTRLDLLGIPHQSGGKNVKTFRWDHRLQIQNLFMTFKRVPLW